jgi:uncharacterized protein YgiM (DUF1202 family)
MPSMVAGSLVLLVGAMSLMWGLAANPATAQSNVVCYVPTEAQLGTLQFADTNGDGILGPAELDRIAGLSPQLGELVADFRAEGYDSIQYQGCTPVTPTVTPITPTATPITPTATPITPTATPITPTATPITPTATPVTPTSTPITPTATTTVTVTSTPVTPTATPVTPTATPVTPTATPITPTVTPVTPTATVAPGTVGTVVNPGGANINCRRAPVNGTVITSLAPGTQVPVRGAQTNGWWPVRCANQDGWISGQFLSVSSTPVTPTATPITPTATPVTPTATPLTPTATPITPTATPITPTTTPVTPTATPITPTTTPVTPTATPVTPTTTPVTPTSTPITPTATPLTPTATATTPPGSGTGTVVNTGGAGLRCRTAAVNGAVITTLSPGAQVPVRGAAVNGWYPVTCAGQNGWVSAQYLSVSGGSTTPTPTSTPGGGTVGTVVNTGGDNLRCRTAPVTGATIVLLAPGTQVQVRGAASNGWYPVVCGGQNGWVSAQYLQVGGGSTTPTPSPTATATATPDPGQQTGTVVNTGGSNLRCRTAPVTGATIVLLAPGTQVQIRGAASNGWYPVVCAGQNGWVSAEYLSVSGGNPGPQPTIAYVDTAGRLGANCRTQPSTGSSIIATLPWGTQVQVRGAAANGWTPVICGGQNGYMSSALLSSQAPVAMDAPLGPIDRQAQSSGTVRTRRPRSIARPLVSRRVRTAPQRRGR